MLNGIFYTNLLKPESQPERNGLAGETKRKVLPACIKAPHWYTDERIATQR